MTAAALTTAIRNPKRPGRPAILPYLTAGYPDRDGFAELLTRVSKVADAIEIGVPFSDPMADGVTIQESSRKALEDGVNLRWILDTVRGVRAECPLLLMSYLNPLLRFGLDRLVVQAGDAGISAFIVPDLPWEECEPFRTAVHEAGLGLVQLVTPITPARRLEKLTDASGGFVYAVTITGITGGALPATLSDYLDRVRAVSAHPVCAGFGIRTAADVQALQGHADGVIVGSALLDALNRGEDPVAFLEGLMA